MKKFLLSAAVCMMAGFSIPAQGVTVDYKVIPDPQLPLSEISHIEIVFPPITEVELLTFPEGVDMSVFTPSGEWVTVNGDWMNYDVGQVLGFDVDEPFTEPGEYIFTIGDDMIFCENELSFLDPIEFRYQVVASANATFEITPAPGAYASLGGTVTVNVKEAKSLSVAEGASAKITETNSGKIINAPLSVSGTTISFDLGENLEKGSYVVTLPVEAIDAKDEAGETLKLGKAEWVYTIPDTDCVAVPEPGEVKTLWEIRVTFPGANTVEPVFSTDNIRLYYPDNSPVDGTPYVMANFVLFMNDAYIMPTGTYRFSIPAGTLKIDGLVYDEDLNFEYEFYPEGKPGAVESVEASDDMDAPVFTISGMRVQDGKVSGKAKGIYIRNGKKVIL